MKAQKKGMPTLLFGAAYLNRHGQWIGLPNRTLYDNRPEAVWAFEVFAAKNDLLPMGCTGCEHYTPGKPEGAYCEKYGAQLNSVGPHGSVLRNHVKCRACMYDYKVKQAETRPAQTQAAAI
jgi:hypothetical protein